MKKLFCGILAMLMLCACAIAEENIPEIEGAVYFTEDTPVLIDLDGDGSDEEVLIKKQFTDFEECLVLYVTGADGGMEAYETFLIYSTGLLAVDMDGDGLLELFISGDVYSDDYNTFCFNYSRENGLYPLQFADAGREVNTGEHFDFGYGKITAINGNQLTLTGSQDVLGTWMASRTFTLKDGSFELEDGGLWIMDDITADPDMLEYFSLTLTRELPVTLSDGSESTLSAGERFVVTRSDKTGVVYFKTTGGTEGSFAIEPDLESGWGSLIGGVSENDYFEYVPYAD